VLRPSNVETTPSAQRLWASLTKRERLRRSFQLVFFLSSVTNYSLCSVTSAAPSSKYIFHLWFTAPNCNSCGFEHLPQTRLAPLTIPTSPTLPQAPCSHIHTYIHTYIHPLPARVGWIVLPKWDDKGQQHSENNCKMRISIICTLYQILLGWLHRGGRAVKRTSGR